MTLPSSGQISLADIDGEFGLGTNLGAYRGVTWYTDAGSTGTFTNTNLGMDQFWGKRATSPVSPTVVYNSQYNNNSNLTSYSLGASSLIIPAYQTMRILVGFASSSPNSTSLSSVQFTSASSNWTAWTGQPNPMPLNILRQTPVYLPAVLNRYYYSGIAVSPSFYINPTVSGVTGVLGTIDLNFTGSQSNCAVVVYFLYDSTSVVYNDYYGNFTPTATSETTTTTAPAKSTLVGIVNWSRGGQSLSFSNITENTEFTTRSGSDKVAAASINLNTTGNYSFTVSGTDTFQVTSVTFVRIYG